MRFVFVDSRHNTFHWLTVVGVRIIFCLILVPPSAYLVAVGFLLSGQTLKPFLPTILFEKISFYLAQLPYFPLIGESVLSQLNQWYKDAPMWWAMVVGVPLIFLGVSIFLINFFSLYYSIFSPAYNQTHCPLCRQPIKAK